ncbi:MAG: hypothetical protein WBL93_06610, partial [Lutisporaceae bacterium]
MNQRISKKISAISITFLLIFSIIFSFVTTNVYALPTEGIHSCGSSYFTSTGATTAVSTDGFFSLATEQYTLGFLGDCVYLNDGDQYGTETEYFEIKARDTLGSFELDSVDVGEYNDGRFENIKVIGYVGATEVFSTVPYSNDLDGTADTHFILNMSAAEGRSIDSFRIYFTYVGPGIDGASYSIWDFSLYSFTISNASNKVAFAYTAKTGTTASFNWTEAISATGIKIQQSLHGADTWSDSTTTVAIATNATS